MNRVRLLLIACLALAPSLVRAAPAGQRATPNVVLILADDLGFGDVGCYGATRIPTPNMDRLSREGLRFTDVHASSATCTPSRYALLTGEYPWRRKGTGILPGNAALIVEPGRVTLPSLFQKAGYHTGAVGKWHLGLGGLGGPDWNSEIRPGPLEVGFTYCFIMAATGDRVPCVFIENHRVAGLDPGDPIQVSYDKPIGSEPTGKDHPELLKLRAKYGHDNTIINGIGRIGYMTGGQAARWKDEEMADTLTRKAVAFIEQNAQQPFFLYFATHDPHVPRVPHPRFVGKSGCGVRGDVIVEFDWSVGEILATLDRLRLATNTLVIVTSDNGPVVEDGYADGAAENLDGHQPAGPFRGGKYTIFEGGTRVPFLLRWPTHVQPGVSDALICLMDLPASMAALVGQKVPAGGLPDSQNVLPALCGQTTTGRDKLVEHDGSLALALRDHDWKFIGRPSPTAAKSVHLPPPHLFKLDHDLGEARNLAPDQPDKVRQLSESLDCAISNSVTHP